MLSDHVKLMRLHNSLTCGNSLCNASIQTHVFHCPGKIPRHSCNMKDWEKGQVKLEQGLERACFGDRVWGLGDMKPPLAIA